jgi:hypothetical protein
MSSTTALARTNVEIPLPLLVDSLSPLVTALDAVTHDERVNYMRGLGARQLGALWDLAKGQSLSITELVGPKGTPGVAICPGKNALPLFSWFQKRFAWHGDQVVGYNHNSAFVTFFVGPGHFVAYDSPDVPGEVWIDYRQLPAGQHPDFPALKSNDRWIGPKLTYGGMVDKLRRVSRHLVIGDSFLNDGTKPKYVKFALTIPETVHLLTGPTGG